MDDIRDIVIDWLHCHYPNLLADDELAEGLIHFVSQLVTAAQDNQQRHDNLILDHAIEAAVRFTLRMKLLKIREPNPN